MSEPAPTPLSDRDRKIVFGIGGAITLGVLFVFMLALAGVFKSDGGTGDRSTRDAPAATADPRQQLYNAFLRQARSDVRTSDPEMFCAPDYWLLVADMMTTATGGDKAILQLAMGDACREGGYVEGVYSAYYADR